MRLDPRHCIALTALAALALAAPARAHLLVTEVGYDTVDETSPTSEYVEILNPDGAPVALGAVWLVGDEDAYPYLVNGPVAPITLGNFIYRFPAVSLGAGKVAVVCQDSDAFLAEFFPGGGLAAFLAQAGRPVLFEVTNDGDADGVPGMLDWGSNPVGTLSMANNGECVGLATWDGSSDLVKDLDWVCWLTSTYIPNKDVDYPLGIDGPDADHDPSFFAEDLANGVPAPDAPQGKSIHRTSAAEVGEVASGGNGVDGHDETSENWSGWVIGDYSPGVTSIAPVGVAPVAAPADGATSLAAAPNPFRGGVSIDYALPRAAQVRLTVHDLAGRVLATLADATQPAGAHRATWDGRDRGGRPVRAGVYFVRLECGGVARCRPLVRLD